jgi:hypothetical protein
MLVPIIANITFERSLMHMYIGIRALAPGQFARSLRYANSNNDFNPTRLNDAVVLNQVCAYPDAPSLI